jgi:glycosyltransferase involved in cell wall biosynthesis
LIKIVLAVTNDIVTDNRLHKVANTLCQNGYSVTLVGRRFSHSVPLFNRSYYTRRFKLWFNKTVLFYANYNLRLLLYLLRVPLDIIVSNDLDTLPSCWLAAKLRKKVLVYDSHELFTELPELVKRPLVKKVWRLHERLLLPGVHLGYTVSQPIQKYFKQEYSQDFELIRNVGYFRFDLEFKQNFDESIIVYQGAVNIGRGLELMIKTLPLLDNVKLWIIGKGDIINSLKKLVLELGLEESVIFFGRIRIDELWKYTSKAHIGMSLEEDMGLNYRYALPNKLFDYIQARLPVVVSDLPEMSKLVDKYEVGSILRTRTPEALAAIIKDIIENTERQEIINQKLELAARELCWEREEERLIRLYRQAFELVNKNNA